MKLPPSLTEAIADRLSPIIWRRAPDFVVGPSAQPYLLRWWLIRRNNTANAYLHQFMRSDEDRALHDHMYPNASLILSGSYREHSADGGSVLRGAGEIVFRKPSTPHRISLIGEEEGNPRTVLTLFLTGPRVRQWGFHCPQGWVHWRSFVDPENPGLSGPGCGDGVAGD